MGRNRIGEKKYREAVACFEKVIQADPGYVDAYVYLGHAYSLLGEYDQAVAGLRPGDRPRSEAAGHVHQPRLGQVPPEGLRGRDRIVRSGASARSRRRAGVFLARQRQGQTRRLPGRAARLRPGRGAGSPFGGPVLRARIVQGAARGFPRRTRGFSGRHPPQSLVSRTRTRRRAMRSTSWAASARPKSEYGLALKFKPDDRVSRSYRAACRTALNDLRGALDDYTEALRLDPGSGVRPDLARPRPHPPGRQGRRVRGPRRSGGPGIAGREEGILEVLQIR